MKIEILILSLLSTLMQINGQGHTTKMDPRNFDQGQYLSSVSHTSAQSLSSETSWSYPDMYSGRPRASREINNSEKKNKTSKKQIDLEELDLQTGQNAIHVACSYSRIETLKGFLTNFPTINLNLKTADKNQNTPLHIAVSAKSLPCVELIVSMPKVSVDELNARGETPLYLAALKSERPIIDKLLRSGANLFLARAIALDKGDFVSASYLLEESLPTKSDQAQVEATDEETGQNSLHIGCKKGSIEIVHSVLQKHSSINLNLGDIEGKTGLHLAVQAGSLECVVELLKGDTLNVNSVDRNNRTPLFYAAEGNHEEIVQILLANKASVSLADKFGRTPLMVALEKGYVMLASALCSAPGDILVHDKEKQNGLHKAVLGNAVSSVDFIMSKDPKFPINAQDLRDKTALHLAVGNSHKDMVQKLVSLKADVTKVDSEGHTPLHKAAILLLFECADSLITQDTINKQDRNKRTPLFCLALLKRSNEEKRQSFAKKLLDKGAQLVIEGSSVLDISLEAGNFEFAKFLLKNYPANVGVNAPLNSIQDSLTYCLHRAIQGAYYLLNSLEVTTELVNNRADLFVEDSKHRTPLYWAVVLGNESIVPLLLEKMTSLTKDKFEKKDFNWFTKPFAEALIQRNKIFIPLFVRLLYSDATGKDADFYIKPLETFLEGSSEDFQEPSVESINSFLRSLEDTLKQSYPARDPGINSDIVNQVEQIRSADTQEPQ